MRILALLVIMFLCVGFTTPKKYEVYMEAYLEEARSIESRMGIPVSIQFAQAIFESQCGASNIALRSNNHFGIRCGDNWGGMGYESASGCWRKYGSVQDSYEDHGCYLSDAYGLAVGRDWKHWVRWCRGYGGKDYWKRIGRVIEAYELWRYDNVIYY